MASRRPLPLLVLLLLSACSTRDEEADSADTGAWDPGLLALSVRCTGAPPEAVHPPPWADAPSRETRR